MITTRTYKLNLVPGMTSDTVVHVSQYDNTTISIKFEIYNGAETFAKPSGASAKVQITKRDKKAVDANCRYNEDGTIEFALSEQMTAVSGCQRGKIVILDSAGGQIGTAAFLLNVDAAGISDNAVLSDSDISDLQKALDKAVESSAKIAAAYEQIEHMITQNDFFAPLIDDDSYPIIDDDGHVILRDWKYIYTYA